MNIYLLLLLRLLHVAGGVLWVGAAALYIALIAPTIHGIGPAGGRFLQHFVERQKYPVYMGLSSIATVLSGAGLYLFASGGLNLSWITSGPGIVFTLGSVAALIAFFMGFILISPRGQRLGKLGSEIGKSPTGPSAAQALELRKLSQELSRFEVAEFVLLSIAMLTMATARYFTF
jgi:hypothetical protein